MDLSRSAQWANIGSFALAVLILVRELAPRIFEKGNMDLKILLVILLITIGLNIANQFQMRKSRNTSYESKDWGKKPRVSVIEKSFVNERVEIDGKSFINCKFTNVTLVFRGEAPFDLSDCGFFQSVNVDATSFGPATGTAIRLHYEIEAMRARAGIKEPMTLRFGENS